MKRLIILCLAMALAAPLFAARQVRVRTYRKKSGKVVQSHVRTSPDKTKANNYSSKPNINPVTGKEGTKQP